jgi:hypothetical protein
LLNNFGFCRKEIMKITISAILTLFVSLIGFFSCQKPQTYPDIPEIKFSKIIFRDTLDELQNKGKKSTLLFNIIDGNGDIGRYQEDTTKDVFIKLFTKKAGAFTEVQLKIPHNYTLPYLTPVGQNKTLKALVKIDIFYTPLSQFPYDTIRYEFSVFDRALNQSNVIISPEIPVKFNGTIVDSTGMKH